MLTLNVDRKQWQKNMLWWLSTALCTLYDVYILALENVVPVS